MTQDEIIDAWNKQADYMNKWDRLGEDEKLEWAVKLEREACWRMAENYDTGYEAAAAIRARGQA